MDVIRVGDIGDGAGGVGGDLVELGEGVVDGVLVAAADDDVGAFGEKGLGGGEAEAGGGGGDEGGFAG